MTACKNKNKLAIKKTKAEEQNNDEKKGRMRLGYFFLSDYIIFF